MISNAIFYILSFFTVTQPEEEPLSNLQIIENLIEHYKEVTDSPITKFTVYDLPFSSFSAFINFIYDYIEEVEKVSTSKITRFNSIKYSVEFYTVYFKLGNRFYTRKEANKTVVTLLERLYKSLLIAEKTELKFYYDSRTPIILDTVIVLLKALHNER